MNMACEIGPVTNLCTKKYGRFVAGHAELASKPPSESSAAERRGRTRDSEGDAPTECETRRIMLHGYSSF